MTTRPGRRRGPALLGALAGAFLVAAAIVPGPAARLRAASAATSLAGSQGTDASLPMTPSQLTVSGHGQYANVRFTVNQTANLTDQAVSVSWTGAPPTFSNGPGSPFVGVYGGDYMQMFQCWSKNAQTDPKPEQCEYGGEAKTASGYPVTAITHAVSRVLAVSSWTCGSGAPASCVSYDQEKSAAAASNNTTAYVDPGTGWVVDPFQAADGTLVKTTVNYACCSTLPYQAFDTNPYFSFATSNELPFARTNGDGTGQALFTAATALRAPGLGCGAPSITNPDGSTSTPACWLVIVPRGSPQAENPLGDSNQRLEVDTSPLSPSAWPNHISIPLGFDNLSAACPAGNIRRIIGSELASPAVASWQPVLCQAAGNPPYSYASFSDDAARSQLVGAQAGGAGMAVVSNPLDPTTVPPGDSVVYAPLTLSAVTVAFNIQRVPALVNGNDIPDEEPYKGSQVIHIYLTPRLVAKLLTESYRGQFFGLNPASKGTHGWAIKNPYGLQEDPDFQQFNPEFKELRDVQAIDSSGLVLEQPTSDTALLLWKWIASDPEATAWLNGQPDPWGMTVNPYYTTNAAQSASGAAFGPLPLESYPKADPYCYQDATPIGQTGQLPRPLCIQDWSPYVNTMKDGAAAARAANSGSKTLLNPGANNPDVAWTASGPQITGKRFMLTVTDSADATRFGLQTASLSPAGDDTANRPFVAVDPAAITAGVAAMKPSPVKGVLTPDPTAGGGAYPLTELTYAAVIPENLDAPGRHDYAAFLAYGAGAGQVQGFSPGQLPYGYVPLPAALAQAAKAAADSVAKPASPIPPTTTTTAPPPTTVTTLAPVAPPPQRPVAGRPARARASHPSSSGPVTTSALTAPTPPSLTPVPTTSPPPTVPRKLALARSSGVPVGAVRFAVPILVALGLAAAAGSVVWLVRLRPDEP